MEDIKTLPATDRPREKMILNGAATLSDAELLAILIGSGTSEMPVMELCNYILATAHYDLETLGEISLDELCKIKGIGMAKAASIIAALEIGKRRLALARKIPKIRNEADAMNLVRPYFKGSGTTVFLLVLLNANYELLAISELPLGGNGMPDIGHMMELTIKAGATGFGLARNDLPVSPDFVIQEEKMIRDTKAAAHMLKLRFFGSVVVPK